MSDVRFYYYLLATCYYLRQKVGKILGSSQPFCAEQRPIFATSQSVLFLDFYLYGKYLVVSEDRDQNASRVFWAGCSGIHLESQHSRSRGRWISWVHGQPRKATECVTLSQTKKNFFFFWGGGEFGQWVKNTQQQACDFHISTKAHMHLYSCMHTHRVSYSPGWPWYTSVILTPWVLEVTGMCHMSCQNSLFES